MAESFRRAPAEATSSAAGGAGTGPSRYTTAWIALTDATPENSCLYCVPREHDPGYAEGDGSGASPCDAVFRRPPVAGGNTVAGAGAGAGPGSPGQGTIAPDAFQNIAALPAPRGTLLCFSHRLLHWGSRPLRGVQKPRIALSLAFADPQFEEPYLRPVEGGGGGGGSPDASPFPEHGVRMALVAGQAIRYIANVPLAAAELAVLWDVFEQHREHFAESYAQNVVDCHGSHMRQKQALVQCHSSMGTAAAKLGNLEEASGHFARALQEAAASRLPMLELLAARDWKRAMAMVVASGSGGCGCSAVGVDMGAAADAADAADAVIDAACEKMGKTRAEMEVAGSGLL